MRGNDTSEAGKKDDKTNLRAYVSKKYSWDGVVLQCLYQLVPKLELLSQWDSANFVWKPTRKGFEQFNRLLSANGLVNHLQHSDSMLTKKDCLQHTLQRYSMEYLTPKTLVLDGINEVDQVVQSFKYDMELIAKPANGFEGKGIIVARSPLSLQDQIRKAEKQERMVVQELLPPMLHNEKKYDLRALVFVDQWKRVHLYCSIAVRLAADRYKLSSWKSVVTNVNKGSSVLGLNAVDAPCDTYNRIREVIQDLFNQRLTSELCGQYAACTFEVFGLDFQLTSANSLYLLEVNENPGLQCHCNESIDADRREAVLEMLAVVLHCKEASACQKWEEISISRA